MYSSIQFRVSAPLIAKRILPLEKHKEIRKGSLGIVDAKAANTARMDALLDFIDEVPSPIVFDTFLEGVKNCESSKQFAKVLKKEVEGGGFAVKLPQIVKLPKLKTGSGKSARVPVPINSAAVLPNSALTSTTLQNSAFPTGGILGNGPGTLPSAYSYATFSSANLMQPIIGSELLQRSFTSTAFTAVTNPVGSTGGGTTAAITVGGLTGKKPPKRPKKPKTENGPLPQLKESSNSLDVFAFNPTATSTVPTTPKSRTAKPAKKATKSTARTTGTTDSKSSSASEKNPPVVSKREKKSAIKKIYSETKAKGKSSKLVNPGPSLTATLVFKKQESTTPNSTVSIHNEGTKGFTTKVPVGSPFRPKNGLTKSQLHAKAMTFQDAENKQNNTTRAVAFSFINRAAKVKKINYFNKSDLFYEGCPTKEGNYMCTKNVQLKGKGKTYICKEKHENDAYELFPRLFVTFEDSTAQLETTLYRENVEILAGKPVSQIHTMNDSSLSAEFSKAIGMNIPIRVTSEKILKTAVKPKVIVFAHFTRLCERIAKDLKSSGGRTWNNVAYILSDSDGAGPPASKKSKKSLVNSS